MALSKLPSVYRLTSPCSSACNHFCALSCPSPYILGTNMPRIPSRQYTMSSSLVTLNFQFLATARSSSQSSQNATAAKWKNARKHTRCLKLPFLESSFGLSYLDSLYSPPSSGLMYLVANDRGVLKKSQSTAITE